MIESKEQLLENFRGTAKAFLAEPTLLTGIDFDDATVTLKRYVLSEMKDQQLASTLAGFQKLIRKMDVAALSELVAVVEERMGG